MLIYNSEAALKQEKFLSNEFEYMDTHYVLTDSEVKKDSANTIYRFLSDAREKNY